MNERGYLVIEYSDQVATLSGIGVFIVACQSRVKRPLIPAAAKEFISVLKLFSGCCEVDMRTLKQRNGECRKSVPFVAPSLSVAGVIFDLSAQGDIHYQAHQQVSFVMAGLANQQLRLRHLHDVLMLQCQNALLFLPFVHQPAADRSLEL